MNDDAKTKDQLDTMFNSGTGFDDATLDSSGKKVGNKTASSPVASATVKPLFDGWIEDFTANVTPAVNTGTTASSGVAGSYTDIKADGTTGRTVKINAKGFELNQIFSKGLIGAFQVDQIVNNYLSFSKLDGAREDNDNGVYGYKNDQAENYITKMEHYWDEGFGYLYGLDSQFKAGLGTEAGGKDTANLNYYLNKVNSQAVWKNPDSGNSGVIYPTRTYTLGGQPCREFTQEINIGGTIQTGYGKACRMAVGSWDIQ